MVRLEELRRAFGGDIHEDGDRRWLDAHMGGLRVRIAYREHAGRRRYELAVFTPAARDLDMAEWHLESPHALPSLQHGFVFAGCRGGVLLATHAGDPALEDLVGTLWELGRWARETWLPPKRDRHDMDARIQRRRDMLARLERLALVALVALAVWLLTGR